MRKWMRVLVAAIAMLAAGSTATYAQFSDTAFNPNICVVEGRLTLPDSSSPPAGHYAVMVLSSGTGNEHPTIGRAIVDSDGRFRVENMPPGRASVIVSWCDVGSSIASPYLSLDYAPPPVVDVDLTQSKPASVYLKLHHGSLLQGKVTDAITGKAAANTTICVYHSGRSPRTEPNIAVTDVDGKFELRLPPGDVVLYLERYDGRFYHSDGRPTLTMRAAEGVDMTAIDWKVLPPERMPLTSRDSGTRLPDDIELRPGTYPLEWNAGIDCTPAARLACQVWDDRAKSEAKKMPPIVSAMPIYWTCQLDSRGDGMLAIVLDESKGTGSGYDTAYVDANRDWDLSNDQPVKIDQATDDTSAHTDWISVNSSQGQRGNGEAQNSMRVQLATYQSGVSGSEPYGLVSKMGAWQGSIESNKGSVECIVVDCNSNGQFSDEPRRLDNRQVVECGDRVFMGINRKASATALDQEFQALTLDPACRIGRKLYSISPTASGNKITVGPYSGPMGSLCIHFSDISGLNANVVSYDLAGETGNQGLSGGSGTVELPAGRYRVESMVLVLQDADSRKLITRAAVVPPISIEPGQLRALEFGGKLSCRIDTKPKWKAGQKAEFSLFMQIGGDVTVNSIGGSGADYIPRVDFIDKAGRVLQTVNAGYT